MTAPKLNGTCRPSTPLEVAAVLPHTEYARKQQPISLGEHERVVRGLESRLRSLEDRLPTETGKLQRRISSAEASQVGNERDFDQLRAEIIRLSDQARGVEVEEAAETFRQTDQYGGIHDLAYAAAARYHGCTVEQMMGSSHASPMPAARRTAWYWLTRREMGASQIGRLANRDHSTILHGVRLITETLRLATMDDRGLEQLAGMTAEQAARMNPRLTNNGRALRREREA